MATENAGNSLSKTASRAQFVAGRAPQLASKVCDAATKWSGTMRLSSQFGWFDDGDLLVMDDGDRLVMVACPGELQRDVDLGLAFGLAHARDRELVLVLPSGQQEATRRRVPWIEPPVSLYTYDEFDSVEWSAPLTRAEVLASVNDELVTAVHQLKDRAAWVERLTAWADKCPELVDAHRPSYLAWHCQGRMALRVRRTRSGLVVSAGVHSSAAGKAPHKQVLKAQLSAEQFHRIVAAASKAIADRVGRLDVANAEHQLQERLAERRRDLGLVATVREFPAVRPVDHRAYIDLLGVGTSGAFHVVETKIGADPMFVLQGLDYWIWTMAHREQLAEHFTHQLDVPVAKAPNVELDFVVAEKLGAFVSPYTAAQAEALDRSIRWQFHTIENWDAEPTTITSLGRHRSPSGPRAAEARYAQRLDADLVVRSEPQLHRRVFFAKSGGGVSASAKSAYDALAERGALHGFVDHVRSSQAFALNLFAGLEEAELRAVWAILEPSVTTIGDVEFEYVDSADALGESQSSRPHQTQVDVLLRGSAADGTRYIALIEVKLSEIAFGTCSAFDSPRNDRRDLCLSPGPWGGDTSNCFQLRNHDGPARRRYDDFLRPAMVTTTANGCPFRELNQPMRNVALALALLDRGEADATIFALCAPAGNAHVWRQWRGAEAIFAAIPGLSLKALPAEGMLAACGPTRRQALSARYGLVNDNT